jgi:glucose/arabinose dehydrogenase
MHRIKRDWRSVCAQTYSRIWGFLSVLIVVGAGWLTGAGPRVSQAADVTASFPPGFVSESFIRGGLELPTAIAFAPNNTIFIAEKRGVVRVWRQGALLPEPFIDLQDEVHNYHDRGLLGLAVHPDFPATPYVYLLYVYDPPGVAKDAAGARVSRLLRVTASRGNPSVADPGAGSRVVVLGKNSTLENIGNQTSHEDRENVACGRRPNYAQDCVPADHVTHSIGTVTFGPDGNLYVSSGDGAGYAGVDERALRALDLDSLAGKILRLDPLTGQGLRDNPFWEGGPDSNRSKVWSYGLRNPFRFTLHPETGELYTGDVGWDTWEELNTGSGKNFGWPCYEGAEQSSLPQGQYANHPATAAACQQLYAQGSSAVQGPLYSYLHGARSAAVAAGAFYTGTLWPAAYRGALFISDYNRNTIQYLTFDAEGLAAAHEFGEAVTDRGGPVQLTFGPDGNLYYVALGAVSEIRRVRFTGNGNTPPVADLAAAVTSGHAPLKLQFSGLGSYDADGQLLTYRWDFGDGGTADTPEPEYVYTRNGTFMAKLTVTDSAGETASAQLEIIVGNTRPDFVFTAPRSYVRYYIGDMLGFSLTGTDAEEGDVSATGDWKVLLHHNEHTHFNVHNQHGHSGELLVEDHGDNTYYELCAIVTDSQGASSVGKCMDVRPFTVRYTFDTEPSGLQVNYAGSTYTTPFTVTTITNAKRQLSAPAIQRGYEFAGWSNDGERNQTLTIEEGPRSFVARYRPSSSLPIYLSDLTPGYQLNGWGPYERDRSNGELGGRDGLPLSLNGMVYAKGLGVHADSELSYDLNGRFSRFLADLGVDDEVGALGSVIFQVFADGEKLYESEVLTGESPPVPIELDVTGRRELRLIVLRANGENSYDHADWANARLLGLP